MTPATYATMPADVLLPADLEPERLHAFHDLLRALGGTLDVRSVFRQVSRIATRIIPHDEAALTLLTEDGKFRLFASTQDDGAPRLLCPGEHDAACDPATQRCSGTQATSRDSSRGFESRSASTGRRSASGRCCRAMSMPSRSRI